MDYGKNLARGMKLLFVYGIVAGALAVAVIGGVVLMFTR